jgi:hypothetical protein
MIPFTGVANVVHPTKDLEASVAQWRALLDADPVFVGEDFAAFASEGVTFALSSAPWVPYPLVLWRVADVAATREALIASGAVPMGEIADGSLAEVGTAEITNGDPATGIVDVGAGRITVLKAPDGNLIGLSD